VSLVGVSKDTESKKLDHAATRAEPLASDTLSISNSNMKFNIGSFLKPYDYTEEAIDFRTAEKNHVAAGRRLLLAFVVLTITITLFTLTVIGFCDGSCMFVPA
jgi:hypothetical protein